jgi:hypothetical protein
MAESTNPEWWIDAKLKLAYELGFRDGYKKAYERPAGRSRRLYQPRAKAVSCRDGCRAQRPCARREIDSAVGTERDPETPLN